MVHLFFELFGTVRRRGGLFLWIAGRQMVTESLHFREKGELAPINS
jgi:hypothetical protein